MIANRRKESRTAHSVLPDVPQPGRASVVRDSADADRIVNRAMRVAVEERGYSGRGVVEQSGLHRSTVSRLLSEEEPRSKT